MLLKLNEFITETQPRVARVLGEDIWTQTGTEGRLWKLKLPEVNFQLRPNLRV